MYRNEHEILLKLSFLQLFFKHYKHFLLTYFQTSEKRKWVKSISIKIHSSVRFTLNPFIDVMANTCKFLSAILFFFTF